MDTINLKDVQDSLNTKCSNKSDERNIKYGSIYLEQRNSKLYCKNSQAYDLVIQSKINLFDLLNTKRKQKQKKDIKQGKILLTIIPLLDVIANSYFNFVNLMFKLLTLK